MTDSRNSPSTHEEEENRNRRRATSTVSSLKHRIRPADFSLAQLIIKLGALPLHRCYKEEKRRKKNVLVALSAESLLTNKPVNELQRTRSSRAEEREREKNASGHLNKLLQKL